MTTRKTGRRTRSDAAQLSVRVAGHVERLISQGKLAAGQRINEVALAGALGVSRAPVREALRGLEAKRRVTRVANRGMFVRELSVAELLDIFDLRALLMGFGAERAAELLDAARKRTLAGLLDRMDDATRNGDGTRYARLNAEYHMKILAFSSNRRAEDVYEELENDLHRFRRRYFDFTPNMVKSNVEHRAVFDAIVRGDGPRARRLAEEHVQRGKMRVLRTIGADASGKTA